jgi:hypothetical protein
MSRRDARRTAGAVGLLGVATAAVAQQAANANFTGSAQVAQSQVRAGTLDLDYGATNRLTVAVDNLYPGVSRYRGLILANSGNQDLASVTISASDTGTNTLFDDTDDGVTVAIDGCVASDGTTPAAFTEDASAAPDYTYTCPGGGTFGAVLAATPISQLSNTALGGKFVKTAGATNWLRFTFTIPTTSSNASAVQGSAASITFTFAGTQRAGAVK